MGGIKFKLTLVKNLELTPTLKVLEFRPKPAMEFKSGQYITLRIPRQETYESRAFSIASPPKRENIELLIRIIPDGLASDFLSKMQEGKTVMAENPLGTFTLDNLNRNEEPFFIASGSGLAPIRSMILDLLINRGYKNNIELAVFNGEKVDVLEKEFEFLQRDNGNFIYRPSLSLGSFIFNDQPNINHKKFFICGGPDIVEKTVDYLERLGVKKRKIILEKY